MTEEERSILGRDIQASLDRITPVARELYDSGAHHQAIAMALVDVAAHHAFHDEAEETDLVGIAEFMWKRVVQMHKDAVCRAVMNRTRGTGRRGVSRTYQAFGIMRAAVHNILHVGTPGDAATVLALRVLAPLARRSGIAKAQFEEIAGAAYENSAEHDEKPIEPTALKPGTDDERADELQAHAEKAMDELSPVCIKLLELGIPDQAITMVCAQIAAAHCLRARAGEREYMSTAKDAWAIEADLPLEEAEKRVLHS